VNLIVKKKSGGRLSADPGDWIKAVIEFIDSLLERRYIIISTTTRNSLYLGLYTLVAYAFFIFKPVVDYSVYLPIFAPFVIALIKLINEVYLTRAERNLEKIKTGTMTEYQIASTIKKFGKKQPEKVIEAIEDLIQNGSFKKPVIQKALLEKYWTYPIILVNYVDNLLLNFDFSLRSLKRHFRYQLNKENLDKLVEKYGGKNEFLFILGRYQRYKFEEDSERKKYYVAGYNFEKTAVWINRAMFVFVILISMGLIGVASFFIYYVSNFDIINVILSVGGMIGILLLIFVADAIHYRAFKKKINTVLKKEGIELEEPDLETFVSEVTRFTYKTTL
jgi:hypothetical protein